MLGKFSPRRDVLLDAGGSNTEPATKTSCEKTGTAVKSHSSAEKVSSVFTLLESDTFIRGYFVSWLVSLNILHP
jgi:hypothetical protein